MQELNQNAAAYFLMDGDLFLETPGWRGRERRPAAPIFSDDSDLAALANSVAMASVAESALDERQQPVERVRSGFRLTRRE